MRTQSPPATTKTGARICGVRQRQFIRGKVKLGQSAKPPTNGRFWAGSVSKTWVDEATRGPAKDFQMLVDK